MRNVRMAGIFAAALMAAIAGQATAGPVGTNFTYQGRLTSAGVGQSASYDIRFQMYDAVTGGTLQGTVIKLAVPLTNGVFTVNLDFGVQFTGDQRWLEISVKPAGGPSYQPLTPRQELSPTPNAQCLRPLAYTGESEPGGSVVYIFNADSTNPLSRGISGQGYQGVYGLSTVGGTSGYGVYGSATDSDATGTYGAANNGSLGYGVWGEAAQGFGVYGDSTSGTGGKFTTVTGTSGLIGTTGSTVSGSAGVQGNGGEAAVRGDGSSYYGVLGNSTASGGTAVQGTCNVGTSGWGVGGGSTTGTGVAGFGGLYGGLFSGQVGVYGTSTLAGGSGFGVLGEGGTGNIGVRGRATQGGGASYGVYGTSSAVAGNGVYGSCDGSGAYGVWGSSVGGYAGYFGGNVTVTGSVSKAGGSFKIDHPLDPANKYLYHSFVESPDMMNIYNGNAVLNGNGAVVVTMPNWFEALNTEFRYQLTAMGAPGPNLYVATEMSNGQFTIAGGTPGGKVSWQVTGIRHDAWANAHRIPVEVDKQGAERGRFIHPDLFGAPEALSMENMKARPGEPAQVPSAMINKGLLSLQPSTPVAQPVIKEHK